jgi:hypothetical protein
LLVSAGFLSSLEDFFSSSFDLSVRVRSLTGP